VTAAGRAAKETYTMAFEDWFVAHARVSSKPHKKTTLDDKMSFFQQLGTLVASGTPLLQALEIGAAQSQSMKLRGVLEQVASRVSAGSSVHAAVANFPDVFQHHWIEIIRTGEITGQMSLVLSELNKQIHDSRETRRKVSGALMYPIILICIAVLAVSAMLWLVVPTFAKMFKDMGAQLPATTQFVVDLSNGIVAYGPYAVVILVVAGVAFRKYARTDMGRRRIIGVGIGLPMIGDLIVQSAMYQFCSNIALLLKSGIPMMETLGVLEGVFQTSPVYRDALVRVQGRVAAGRPLASSLDETGLFTTMITNMVHVGEESGQLALVMEQLAPYYKEKMETMIARVTKLLEPIIIVGMGSTVAGLMLSIYMPMFEMAGNVH
jgi:type IV pilus assembly protein PilC